ncbi:hypothetical protein VPH35_045705 [Triticum aestivum]
MWLPRTKEEQCAYARLYPSVKQAERANEASGRFTAGPSDSCTHYTRTTITTTPAAPRHQPLLRRGGIKGGEQRTAHGASAQHGVAPLPRLPAQEALVQHQHRAEEEERDLHPVRRRQVVPVRGRARALVHPRRVPRPPAAHTAGAPAHAVTGTRRTADRWHRRGAPRNKERPARCRRGWLHGR